MNSQLTHDKTNNKIKIFPIKHFAASFSLELVHFTHMTRTPLKLDFSDILGYLSLVQ